MFFLISNGILEKKSCSLLINNGDDLGDLRKAGYFSTYRGVRHLTKQKKYLTIKDEINANHIFGVVCDRNKTETCRFHHWKEAIKIHRIVSLSPLSNGENRKSLSCFYHRLHQKYDLR